MTKIDKEIDDIISEGEKPVLLLGVNALKDLVASGKVLRRPGHSATYRNVGIILNSCNPDKCELVVTR